MTEGGIRVPFIFRWKGKIGQGKWVDVPIDCTDIYPTILEAPGYDSKLVKKTMPLVVKVFLLYLKTTKTKTKVTPKKTHYWHYPFNVIYNSPF